MQNQKNKISGGFSRFAASYDRYAEVQELAAGELAARFAELALPPGPLLEIGCGTGLLSARLLAAFPEREIYFTDLAVGMVEVCRRRLARQLPPTGRHHWQVMDGEQLPAGPPYALIVSGLTMQWFADLEQSLHRLLAALAPGGYLLFSVVGNNSFADWRRLCVELAIPCTINPLPALTAVEGMVRGAGRSVSCQRREALHTYPSAREFFRSLQGIGAGTNLSGQPLTAAQLRTLIRAWDELAPGGVTVNYEILYTVARKE